MEYILITIMTLSVMTLIIYKIANLFKLQLKLKPLILCAVCALFISLILPRIVMGYAGFLGTLGILAIFAVIFAYFVAYYDEKKLITETHSIPSAVFAGPNEVVNDDYQVSDCPQFIHELDDKHNEATLSLKDADHQDELIAEPAPYTVSKEQLADDDESDEAYAIESYAELPLELSTMLKESACETVIAELAASAANVSGETDTNTYLNNSLIEIKCEEEVTSVEEDHETQQASEISLMSKQSLLAVQVGETASEILQENETGDKAMTEETPIFVLSTNNLDELLDYAFEQKEELNYGQALAAFQQILKLYPESDAAPYIVIEIGNILKNKGAYDDAIKVFLEGKLLPASRKKVEFEQEFVNTIAYLRIIKNTLVHRRLGLIPYGNIPEAVMAEIDAEFREWRNLA